MKFNQFSSQNKLDEDTQNNLKLQGVQEASRDADGNLVYKSLKEKIPKSYQDIANFALNPYNRFPDNIARGTYLDKLSEVVARGKDKSNRPLYTGKTKTKILTDLLNLKTFYTGSTGSFKGLDYYTNTGIKPADALKELDPATDIQKVYNELLKNTIASHLFLTQNAMGKLPTFDELSATVKNNKTNEDNKPEKPKAVSKGGVIYASTGTLVDYQPRGTDTVPAMLTPGEFVVNKASTQKNLPLLKAINNGAKNPKALSKGGIAYLDDGGLADVQQGFANLGSYYPDSKEIEKVKLDAESKAKTIAQYKLNLQKCREEFSQEEKTKTSNRLQAMNSDEHKADIAKSKADHIASIKKREALFSEMNSLKAGFTSQFKADLAKVKAETGLTSLKDIFAKFPRLDAENEFIQKGGNLYKDLMGPDGQTDPNVLIFREQIEAILDKLQYREGPKVGGAFDLPVVRGMLRLANMHELKPRKADDQSYIPTPEGVNSDGVNSTDGSWPNEASRYPAQDIDRCIRRKYQEAAEAQNKQHGGMIYASQGTLVNYQPRGTDTVPAMLTPGEFVINKQATQRNLPLLKSINSHRYQTGGIVQPQYHDIGDMVSGASKAIGGMAGAVGIKLDTSKLETEINKALSDGAKMLSGVLQLSGQDRNALSSFGDNFKSLLSQMSQINIPPEIRFSMAPVQVNITGAQGLTDVAQGLIDGAIKKAFDGFLSVNNLLGTYKSP